MTGSNPGPGAAASCAAGPFQPYTGSNNTAIGEGAYCTSTTGKNNTIVGYQSGVGLNSGYANTYVGSYAGSIGTVSANSGTGNYNTFIGYESGNGETLLNIPYSNSTALGYNAVVSANNQMVFGNSSVTQILVPAGVSISSQDTGAPAITFSPNNVSLTVGGVSGSPAAVVATVPSNTFTSESTQPLTVFYTTAAAGQYLLCAQLSVKAAGSGAGTFTAQMAYTSDGVNINMALGNAVPVATLGASNRLVPANGSTNCVMDYLDNDTTVSWEIAAGGTISAAPTMRYGFKAMYLGE
jgi:hypothetical protein